MNDPAQPAPLPSAPAQPPLGTKKRRRIAMGILAVLVFGIVTCMAIISQGNITKTLPELRATCGNELKGEPEKTGTNGNDDKYYIWNYKNGTVCVIANGGTEKVKEVNCIVASRSSQEERFNNAAAFARLGLLIDSLSNHTISVGSPEMESCMKWAMDNADKQGALSRQGGLTVVIKEVTKASDGLVTTYNLY